MLETLSKTFLLILFYIIVVPLAIIWLVAIAIIIVIESIYDFFKKTI